MTCWIGLHRPGTEPPGWVTTFTYVRTSAGLCYVAKIVHVFAQKIVAWHVPTAKDTNLVMTLCGWHCGSATERVTDRCLGT